MISRPVTIGLATAALAAGVWGGVQTYRLGATQDELTIALQDVKILKGGAIIAIQRAKLEKSRIEREQDAITQRIENETRTELDAVRAKYSRLLSTRADRGSAGAPNLPFNMDCLGITPDASVCDRLLAYRDEAGRLAEQAERNTTQLNKLIDAYEAQSAINREPTDGR